MRRVQKLIWTILFVFAASALGTPALLAQDAPPAAQEPTTEAKPARDIEDISAEQIEADRDRNPFDPARKI